MPCLIYGYPRDWKPVSLTLVVVFRTRPYPTYVWDNYTDNILKLPHGEKRYPLRLNGDGRDVQVCEAEDGQVYGVWWEN